MPQSSIGLRPYKTGTNKGYESQVDKKKREAEERKKSGRVLQSEIDAKRAIPTKFRGFVGGKQFRTKLGFQGNAFDSLWGKHVFLSMETDDVELFDVAMSSDLADIQERVNGGEFGSAFMIGAVGFYARSQFEAQGNKIRDYELTLNKGVYYLSDREMGIVNSNIKKIADYANHATARAVRGDSFGALALRSNAYKVSKRMLEIGLDPMVENEESEDLFSILEEQYNRLTGYMHDILVEKEEGSNKILVPSEQVRIDTMEESCLQDFRNMLHFLQEFNNSLNLRNIQIKADKNLKRRMELQRKVIPKEMLFNISCEEKCLHNYTEGCILEKMLIDRIKTYEKGQQDHVSLADLMRKQHKLVERKLAADPTRVTTGKGLQVWSYKDDEVSPEISPISIPSTSIADSKVNNDDNDDHAQKHENNINTALELRAKKEKDRIRKSHGLETDDEIAAREAKEAEIKAIKDAEEEEAIMAIDFMADEKMEEERKKNARLEKESYSELRGVLHKSEYETTSYR